MIEKATLDAFYVEEISPWRTSVETQTKVDKCLTEISRILKHKNGRFISIAFTSELFRIPILAKDKYNWNLQKAQYDCGHLPYSFYCMTRGENLDDKWKTPFQTGLKCEDKEDISDSSDEDFESACRLISSISISSSSSINES